MNRAEISSCLQGSLDALSGGFLFYYREALGPNEQTPFGEKLDPEAEGIFHELLREDEKHVSDVLDAIEGFGETPEYDIRYDMDRFYFNYLVPEYMVRILADHLEADVRTFEGASEALRGHQKFGGLLQGILNDKKRHAARFRDLNEKRQPTAEAAETEGG